jgi:hypothetical protein
MSTGDATEDDDRSERDWTAGHRAALTSMLGRIVRDLAGDGAVVTREALLIEREEAVAMLRQLCERLGCNTWGDDLHLADVIDKHLWRRLDELLPEEYHR